MNVEFEDEEFAAADVESRVSELNKQSNDPPPFTGTRSSEFKRNRKKVKLWLLFTCTPVQLQGHAFRAGCQAQLGVLATNWNQRMWPLARFPGEHETELFDALEDTCYGPGRKKGEKLYDYALRIQRNVRELAKQELRLPECKDSFYFAGRT